MAENEVFEHLREQERELDARLGQAQAEVERVVAAARGEADALRDSARRDLEDELRRRRERHRQDLDESAARAEDADAERLGALRTSARARWDQAVAAIVARVVGGGT